MPEGKKSPAHERSANVLFLCAAALVPWIVFLAVTMRSDEYVVARWGMAWVGLDIAEAVGLVGVALLVRRRDVRASPVAAASGTLFLVDAWFDTVTSHTTAAYLQSLFSASLAELPLTAFCAVTAWRAVRWFGAPQAAHTSPGVREKTTRRSRPGDG